MPTVTASLSVEDVVNRRRGDLVELSHSIHAEPELAFAEHRSCAKTQALVAERGFEITAAPGGLDTAFRADFGSGPLTVGICAEYDALPDIGHACGHNIIPRRRWAPHWRWPMSRTNWVLGFRCSVRRPRNSVAERYCCSTPES